VHSTFDMLHELRNGWRIVVPIVIAQLLGAALLIAIRWPNSVGLLPEAPTFVSRSWFGAVFALPVGFLVGIALQQSSTQRASPMLVWSCAAAAVILPLIGICLLYS
jgi:hypothetical protein